MTPLDTPLDSLPPERLADHMRGLKAFLRSTSDPNATGDHGLTCLLAALAFCNTEAGEPLVESLLQQGADPNRPTALANFKVFMTATSRLAPLEQMLRAGLKLNEIYPADQAFYPDRSGPFTILDYACDVESYLNKGRKPLKEVVEKHAGPLTGRRRFVADVITLLKSHGAIRARGE